MDIEEARRILGTKAKSTSDEQIRCLLATFDHLADFVLDSYEKKVFGKPLKELGVDIGN